LADLPGYVVKPFQRTPDYPGAASALRKCLHTPAAPDALLANSASADFAGPGLGGTPTVKSYVAIWASASLLDQRLKAASGQHGISCVLNFFTVALRHHKPKGVSFKLHGETLPPVVRGSTPWLGFRLIITVRAKPAPTEAVVKTHGPEVSASLFIDFTSFVYGNVAVNLIVETIDAPPRFTLEQHLSRLLLARTEKAFG
jgi:hypothetical protein